MSKGRFDNPLIAALTGFLDLFRPQPLADRLWTTDSFSAKTVLVTGANSGLGFAIAAEAARRDARVIACGRRQLEETAMAITGKTGRTIDTKELDLSSLASIHSFVDTLVKDDIRLDVLYLNAATTLPASRQLDNGQDEMFFVNYLANFILVNLLMDAGRFRKNDHEPRIIFISSDSHQGSSEIDYDEFGRYFDYGVSKAINNYSYLKLVLNTFAVELGRRQPGTQVNVICPGPVNSNIIKEAPFILRMLLRAIFTVIFKSPAKAAMPVIYLGISDDFTGRTGVYLHMFNEKQMDKKVYDPAAGTRLWRESSDLWESLDS